VLIKEGKGKGNLRRGRGEKEKEREDVKRLPLSSSSIGKKGGGVEENTISKKKKKKGGKKKGETRTLSFAFSVNFCTARKRGGRDLKEKRGNEG